MWAAVVAALAYTHPLSSPAQSRRRAAPIARASGVMQQPSPAHSSRANVPVSISTTGFNSRCISVSAGFTLSHALAGPAAAAAGSRGSTGAQGSNRHA
eukprot:scaffold88281_cov32-Tisochrysis_lutea.AAC.1